jgi:hypothetical protein
LSIFWGDVFVVDLIEQKLQVVLAEVKLVECTGFLLNHFRFFCTRMSCPRCDKAVQVFYHHDKDASVEVTFRKLVDAKNAQKRFNGRKCKYGNMKVLLPHETNAGASDGSDDDEEDLEDAQGAGKVSSKKVWGIPKTPTWPP